MHFIHLKIKSLLINHISSLHITTLHITSLIYTQSPLEFPCCNYILNPLSKSDIFGYRNRGLQTCTAVPEQTAPPRVPTSHEDLCMFMIISHRILLKMENVSDKYCRQIRNIFYVLKYFSLNRDNVGKYGRVTEDTEDNIILGMHLAWWITQATDPHSE